MPGVQISDQEFLRKVKNSLRRAAHSSARMPGVISLRWLSPGICRMLRRPPAAPPLGSRHPKITRRSLAWTIAPAHIGQGSLVT